MIEHIFSALIEDEQQYKAKIDEYRQFGKVEDPYKFAARVTGLKLTAMIVIITLLFAAIFISATIAPKTAKVAHRNTRPQIGEYCGVTEKQYDAGWGNDTAF